MNIEQTALNKIKADLKNLELTGFTCAEVDKKNYNFESTIQKNGQKIKLQIYFGKKGVKTVLQGNSETFEYQEAQNIVLDNLSLLFTKTEHENYNEYIGTDETGKGDYFGPLVVAGMYVNKESQKYLANLGVRDSKELTDPQINKIAKQIEKKYKNHFSVIIINPEKYNQLYESFKNVNKLLNWAHSKVIENLLRTCNAKVVITDQFSKTDLEISNKVEYSDIEFIQMPKAEKYLGVAAASILARYEMNKWFDRNTKYNVLKGASSEVEKSAKQLLNKIGEEQMKNFVKLHFKTTLKILTEFSKT